MRNLIFTVLASVLAISSINAKAADCNIIYDEYESLMNKYFLIFPGWYTTVKENRISRDEYNGQQKPRLLLKTANKGHGVAIVHTNNNTWGKLLYTWSSSGKELIIKEAIMYGRVMDGGNPRTLRNIRIPSSWSYDLDTGTFNGPDADIWFHNVDGKTMYMEERNGADLSFPMESLCE